MKKNLLITIFGVAIFILGMLLAVRHIFSAREYEQTTEPFKLPPLPYSYNALEPYIDTQTMHVHHDGHHQAYVDNLNRAVAPYPELQTKTVEELLTNLDTIPAAARTAVTNNAGGHYNHSLFWLSLSKHGGEPMGALKDQLIKDFGSIDAFKEKFTQAAKSFFGSGWVWLVMDDNGSLKIITTANQDCPLTQHLIPLLPFDVWEHAYYLKYTYKRLDYITAWWHVVNWHFVADKYQKAVQARADR